MTACPFCQQLFECDNEGHPTTPFCAKCRAPIKPVNGLYRLNKRLGTGGFGVVYLAEHIQTNERVAIKLLRAELFEQLESELEPEAITQKQQEIIRRFQQEIEVTAELSKETPHIVEVYGVGEDPDLGHYYTMEYLEGKTLDTLLIDGQPFPFRDSFLIMEQLCHAMDKAHQKGIVHRDLKPENIFLLPDLAGSYYVKIIDFGIAKSLFNLEGLTLTPGVLGSMTYISPEQGKSEAVDQRTDIYALGGILYRLLTGTPPFLEEGATALLLAHLNKTVEPPTKRRPDLELPEELSQLILRSLNKNPARRFDNANEFWDAIKHFVNFEPKRKNARYDVKTLIEIPEDFQQKLLQAANEQGLFDGDEYAFFDDDAPTSMGQFPPANNHSLSQTSLALEADLPLEDEEFTILALPGKPLTKPQDLGSTASLIQHLDAQTDKEPLFSEEEAFSSSPETNQHTMSPPSLSNPNNQTMVDPTEGILAANKLRAFMQSSQDGTQPNPLTENLPSTQLDTQLPTGIQNIPLNRTTPSLQPVPPPTDSLLPRNQLRQHTLAYDHEQKDLQDRLQQVASSLTGTSSDPEPDDEDEFDKTTLAHEAPGKALPSLNHQIIDNGRGAPLPISPMNQTKPTPMTRKPLLFVAIALLLLTGGALYWWFSQTPQPTTQSNKRRQQPTPISTKRAKPTTPPNKRPPTNKAGYQQPVKGLENAHRIWIPPGSFVQGSPKTEPGRFANEGPQRLVKLTHGFWMWKTEVTQRTFKSVMGYNPSQFKSCGPSCPVEQINWFQAIHLANSLSKQQGLSACFICGGEKQSVSCELKQQYQRQAYYKCPGWRLPTEAEWEYAARAGNQGMSPSKKRTHSLARHQKKLASYAWFSNNSDIKYKGGFQCNRTDSPRRCGTHPVGSKQPNAWGLHGLLGHVWEWCYDWYSPTYTKGRTEDPIGAPQGTNRIGRGGSWNSPARLLRNANRGRLNPKHGYSSIGVRLVRTGKQYTNEP